MKRSLQPVFEARDCILGAVSTLPQETVPLRRALGRVLAREIKAKTDRPAFDRSAMDGYAIANPQDSSYALQGEVPAGTRAIGMIKPGHCLRIFTGSALPANCLAVIPQELAKIDGTRISVKKWPKASFIRRRGEDVKRGARLLGSLTRLSAPEMAVLAQEGIVKLPVRVRVQVFHLAMGKELVDPSRKPAAGQIRDSNSALIASLLADPAFHLSGQRRIPDAPEPALHLLQSSAARKSSVLLVSGGAGPGDHDWGRMLIKKLGFRTLVDGVDLRPGKPLIAARKGKQTLFILPGNPVSHWVTWHLFVRPLLLRLAGIPIEHNLLNAALQSSWSHTSDPRDVWWPGRWSAQRGRATVWALPLQSSGDASKLAGANCLVHFPRGKQGFLPGESVSTMLFNRV